MEVLGHLRYTKVKSIGVGQGMNSEVYLAEDAQLGGQIAVKEIPKSLLREAGMIEFFNEARMMFAAKHPRHVVPILYGCDIPNADTICLAMPFYKQGSLLDRIKVHPLPLKEVVRIGLAMLSGIGAIHAKGLLHFDLKPSNVLFSDQDEPLVADFGQARAATMSGKTQLPPLYPDGVPPEYYTTGVGEIASDIYHAGMTLYRAVNGNPFFASQKPDNETDRESRTIAGTFPRRDRFLPHVPKAMRTIIRTAMAVDPDARYRSAADMSNAIANLEIPLDWRTAAMANGEFKWDCARGKKPNLVVRLMANGKRWNVTTCTSGDTERKKGDKCLTNASLGDAMTHLKSVFEQLP
jgi:serine/threonine protein kinase